MILKVCTLELLSEDANQIIVDRLGLHVEYIDRSQLSSLKVNESTVLICRDRDDWNDIFRVFPFLRFVFILSVGVEKLPFDELLKRNIVVANSGGLNAPIMSEYAMGIILSHSTRLVENINNKIFKPNFANARLNCGQKCRTPGKSCHICETYFTIIAQLNNFFLE